MASDRDPDALDRAKVIFDEFPEGATVLVNDNFRNLDKILECADIKKIDGAIFDLGFSSFQIDDATKGFSFMNDGPLDMRFDASTKLSAQMW